MKRVARLDGLTSDQRALVLALIAADKAAHSQKPLPSPDKPTGAAPSKEKRT